MKKWLVVFLILFLILFALLYLFIPNVISISRKISVKANAEGLYRNLEVHKKWQLWWPGTDTTIATDRPEQIFYLNGYAYTIEDKSINSLSISISDNKISTKTLLHIIPLKTDSVKLVWTGAMATSINPLIRIHRYFKAKDIERNLEKILEGMKTFFSKNENIYGIAIKQEAVVDSILISTYATSAGYPTIPFIYGLIDQLKNYTRGQSAKETGYPMLNVSTTDSINFLTKVALPVNKKLKDSGTISYKWMLGGGKILVTEIKGGPHSIEKAFTQMEQYVSDYNRLAPAIPFRSLVTDQMKEPDTNKWVTRIFWPVL
ncbi:MAG: hypothetical protein ABR503_11440 [Chitinophagaceae bacterium]